MEFDEQKKEYLKELSSPALDKSKKGTVDVHVVPILDALNAHAHYYTTSSCSGRIVVYNKTAAEKKHETRWLLTSHNPVDVQDVLASLEEVHLGTTWFRFEPMILHVCCRTLATASTLLSLAHTAGFKHSGIVGCEKRIIVEIRGTDFIDAPLVIDGTPIVLSDAIEHVVALGNEKMAKNTSRIQTFYQAIEALKKSE